MDCSELVLSVIKDETIRKNINPIVYYSIKLIYNPEFTRRSRIFCRCIRLFFESISKELNIKELTSSVTPEQLQNNNYMVNLLLHQLSPSSKSQSNTSNNVNAEVDQSKITSSSNSVSPNKSLSDLFDQKPFWYIEKLWSYQDVYILDNPEDYSWIYMLQDYILDTQDPRWSEIMRGYNLFVSSVELLFCFRWIWHFPDIGLMRKEKQICEAYFKHIHTRVCKFCVEWCKIYPEKYQKSRFIQTLIQDWVNQETTYSEQHQIDFIALSLDEPIWTPKYVGWIKWIREGPFFYEINEIARQLCVIDHDYLSSIPQKDYIDYIVKKEIPDSFNKIYTREMRFKCYIVIFLLLIKNWDNQKNAVQNFIALAHQCKQWNNYQTEYSIISTLSIVGISKKKLLWRLVEKKYRDIYLALEQEYWDVDLNEKTFFDQIKKGTDTFVPHIDVIKNQINNFIIQIKMSSEAQKVTLCREYRDFFSKILDYSRNKYSFFLVNPWHDFWAGSFWEICKTKQWGIKSKYDFSQYADQDSDAEKFFDMWVRFYKRVENN